MANETQILFTIIAGSSVIFGLAASIVLFVVMYNRKLKAKETDYQLHLMSKEMDVLRAVINTQESERDKIAKNLHDEVGPMVTSLKLKITKHQRDIAKGEFDPTALDDEKELTDMLIDNIRSVSHDLSPQFLRKQGLIQALKSYVNNIEGVETKVQIEFDNDEDLNGNLALNVYRIALELINNLLKHDNPTKVAFELYRNPQELELFIRHDGKGISNKEFVAKVESGRGLGLESLKSRTIILGATLDYQKEPAIIKLTVPLNGEEN